MALLLLELCIKVMVCGSYQTLYQLYMTCRLTVVVAKVNEILCQTFQTNSSFLNVLGATVSNFN